ncbi:hypothetical protein FNO01nite_07120 [Flavobacterium noncentrifugens]|uniref:O-Antigen ligase n=1 Tax=Flavobacterium noncentrifugens TaxID=1128970 RepID=A0A1G8T0Q1_9FLAO|nr:O-antigen ligase family protein [Flavobacterium noncentrifugens]GEP50040.1 hypothetical protein FNO01nite_07120 [Flavobacterium noncentrifugens]SDJ35016.1 O-Antigen ligase [Flavobacterium noncentrifugens]
MGSTYNYLKNAFLELKQESSKNPGVASVILLLWSIQLPYSISSISLGILAATAIFTFKKSNFTTQNTLLLPIALFAMMAMSLIWSIDLRMSLKGLSKSIPLALVPLCFLIYPAFTAVQKHIVLRFYSLGMLVFVGFYLIKATIRFAMTQQTAVFFYHELVTEDVNAIHVSVYVAIAAIYFLCYSEGILWKKIAAIALLFFMVLLSSKNIIIVVLGLLCYHFYTGSRRNLKIGAVFLVVAAIGLSGKIKERFVDEFSSNASTVHQGQNINKVSVGQAWNNPTFSQNNYFAGTAFRVYQIRIFKEMLQADPGVFFTGYGLNATDEKIKEKGAAHNVFSGDGVNDGYQNKNFHNEYIQVLAETGIFGLLILLSILIINTIKAVLNENFIHISFAIIMISLFLTESFLSRQRGIIFFTIMYCLFNGSNDFVKARTEKNI